MKRLAKAKIRSWLRRLLHTQDSPQRTSFAFALGVFIAFLPPVPWFHTLFALFLAFLFRLNRLATVIGTYVNTPLTILPLVAIELSIGLAIVGGQDPPEVTWHQLRFWQGWKDAFVELRPFLAPLLVGCIVMGLVTSVIAYFIALKLILVYRHRVAYASQAAQMELELPPPPSHAAMGTAIATPGIGPVVGRVVDTPENPT